MERRDLSSPCFCTFMKKTRVKEMLSAKDSSSLLGVAVSVCGWIRTVRQQKSFAFIEVNDGSTLSNLQIIMESTLPGYATLLPQLSNGTSVQITGQLTTSPGKNQALELRAQEIHIFGACDPAHYPLQKKRHSFEFL